MVGAVDFMAAAHVLPGRPQAPLRRPGRRLAAPDAVSSPRPPRPRFSRWEWAGRAVHPALRAVEHAITSPQAGRASPKGPAFGWRSDGDSHPAPSKPLAITTSHFLPLSHSHTQIFGK